MDNNNPKARQAFIDLDNARCNETWSIIPELAKRYKKYHPNESVLEFTARMEAEFIVLTRQIRYGMIDNGSSHHDESNDNITYPTTLAFKREIDCWYQLDDPNHISLPPKTQPSQAQLILVRLLDVIQRQIKAGELLETSDDWQIQFSKIILARIFFETGRYEKAFEWLQHIALKLEDVESGYGLVLLIQARFIKGVCFELQENYSDALDSYSNALKVAEQHPEEKNNALFFWLEDCLYRSILLQLRKKGPVKQTLKLMRTYLNYCQTQWLADWRSYKRWVIFRHYIRYLTRAYQKGLYVPESPNDEYTISDTVGTSSRLTKDNLSESSNSALHEIMTLLNQFRSLLSNVFVPLLQTSNPMDLHHRTLELSNLLVTAHEAIGWGKDELYLHRLGQFFHRSQKWIQTDSLCMTRHRFCILVRLKNRMEEAKLAFIHYSKLLGIPLPNHYQQQDDDDDDDCMENRVESIRNKLNKLIQQSLKTANKNVSKLESFLSSWMMDYPESDELFSSVRKPPIGSFENDSEFDVVRLLLIASQQIYGQHDKGGYESSMQTQLAVAILEGSVHLKKKKPGQWKILMAQSKRMNGVAYGLYASQCQIEKPRFKYLTQSISSLKNASELDTRSWQTFYELGLQQTIMGDITSAITSIQRSIKLKEDFIPSWHLLALLYSSRQLYALPKSLELIQQCHNDHYKRLFDMEKVMTLDTEEGQEFFERAESYIKMQMTQVTILEILEGSEAVLDAYLDLFNLYAKLSKKMNLPISKNNLLIIAKKKKEEEEEGEGKEEEREKYRQRSIASRDRNDNSRRSSISRPRSYSATISRITRNDDDDDDVQSLSLSQYSLHSQNPILAVVNENDHSNTTQQEISYFTMLQNQIENVNNDNNSTAKSNKKHTSRQLIDDPLLSFPISTRIKKERKESINSSSDNRRKSHFLSFKTSFRNSISHPLIGTTATVTTTTTTTAAAAAAAAAVAALNTNNNDNSNANIDCNDMNNEQRVHNGNYSSSSLLKTTNKQLSSTLLTNQKSSSLSSQISLDVQKNKATFKHGYDRQHESRWRSILVRIWIMVCNSYQNLQQFEEAFKAIEEAEQLTYGHDADVWHQVGLLKNDDKMALEAFKKALSIDPNHIATHISLASLYLSMKEFDLAEDLLQNVTHGLGWNQPKAWYLLSQVYKEQEHIQDAKNCLLYAIKLSDIQPIIYSFDRLLPRFV
ncbi:uncharacterized protein BX663DRAFT_488743 [Cokeromyces recurvatus]|uniref:uncharacterized protein n=1 Tax=Cokeromyces recurvatus TaxID=90255 RepID=UPI00221F4B96|nr:uncharacterized protein BX663DRAFT_488743 [Cokeromyces recurvatus]KAI7899995.1 hypothetical protein BX663DRAFT_488743 [Cokeromyces recurvatus]